MKRVKGIGGIFFQSESPEHLYDWYEKHLGIKREPHGQGAAFEWRELQAPDGSEPGAKGATAWSIFPRSTKYFGASKASFMPRGVDIKTVQGDSETQQHWLDHERLRDLRANRR